VLLPVIGVSLPRGARAALWAWIAAFVLSAGLVYVQPWSGRFHVVLFAGLALLWAGARMFARGGGRWLLAGITGLNVLALLASVGWYTFRYVARI
jgi:hypothetical protein